MVSAIRVFVVMLLCAVSSMVFAYGQHRELAYKQFYKSNFYQHKAQDLYDSSILARGAEDLSFSSVGIQVPQSDFKAGDAGILGKEDCLALLDDLLYKISHVRSNDDRHIFYQIYRLKVKVLSMRDAFDFSYEDCGSQQASLLADPHRG